MKLHLDGSGCRYAKSGYVVSVERLSSVNCLICKNTATYFTAKDEADAKRQAAFEAQEPRTYGEPWGKFGEVIVCKSCQGNLFRRADRTCMGHYDNWVCAACGHTESRLTETGMSF